MQSKTDRCVTPQDVVSSLMNDGTFDSFTKKIIARLKSNRHMHNECLECTNTFWDYGLANLVKDELRKNTITMVQQSKVLNTPEAENKTRRELFDALRKELETPVLDKASQSVWELILDKDGLGKEIDDMVESVFWRLNGLEPPAPSSRVDCGSSAEETSSLPSKKRTFSDMNADRPISADNIAHANSSVPQQVNMPPSGGEQVSAGFSGNAGSLANSSKAFAATQTANVEAVSASTTVHHTIPQHPGGAPIMIPATGPSYAMVQSSGIVNTVPPGSNPMHGAIATGHPYMYNATAGHPHLNAPAAVAFHPANSAGLVHMLPVTGGHQTAPIPMHTHMGIPAPGYVHTGAMVSGPLQSMHTGAMVCGSLQPMPPLSTLVNTAQVVAPMGQPGPGHFHLINSGPGYPQLNNANSTLLPPGTLPAVPSHFVNPHALPWNPPNFNS